MADAQGSSSVSFHVVAVVVGGFFVFCRRGGWLGMMMVEGGYCVCLGC